MPAVRKTPSIDELARAYHEICREMINQQIGLITKPTQPYIEWDQLTDDQKNGRYFIAEQLLLKYTIRVKP